jgi:signal transduction histidine kinase
MKIWDYIKDKKYLIGFYFLLMIFISSGFYLDPSKRVSLENILYINTVSGVFFLIYLLGGYIYRRNYFRQINDAVGRHEMDILNHLPEPRNYEQKIFNELFKDMYEGQRVKIERLYEDKRENQEYVATWVHEVKTPISVLRLILENSGEKSKEEILGSIEEELDKIKTRLSRLYTTPG